VIHGVGDMAGALKSKVIGLVKDYTVGLPGKIIGGIGGEIKDAPGIHSPYSAEKYLVPWAQREGITVTSVAGGGHVPGSYHYKHRAIDVDGGAGMDRKFFLDSIRHFGQRNITELFYDPMGYYIKNGQRVSGAIGGHRDHVHIALGEGGIVTKAITALMGEKGREAVIPLDSPRARSELGGLGGTFNFYFPNYHGDERQLMDLMRKAAKVFENRNGRPAFGGA